MLDFVARRSPVATLAAALLALTGLTGAPAAQTGSKAQTAAVEKQAGQAGNKSGGQSIVALVNDEPVTAYEVEQRARFLSLSCNIGGKVKECFKRIAERDSNNRQLGQIRRDVV